MDPAVLIEKASHSKFYMFLLNISLGRIIPFNRPHGIGISEISEWAIRTHLPYKRKNLNHIKGLHACGLATLAEFTTGLSLLRSLDSKKYRIIMKEIRMEYYFQGKSSAWAEFAIQPDWLSKNVEEPLTQNEKVDVPVEIEVFDREKHHLATGFVTWQVKDWQKVKTKL